MTFLRKWLGGDGRGVGSAAVEAEAADRPPADGPDAPLMLDIGRWYARAEELPVGFRNAAPFPHLVLEEFLAMEQVRAVLRELAAPAEGRARRRGDAVAGDRVRDDAADGCDVNELGPALRELLWELNSGTFLRLLEKLSGTGKLIADPDLRGAGVRRIPPGGSLAVRGGESRHSRYGLDRRLGILVYLNQDWSDAWGGELELWSKAARRCGRRIKPLAGRCVVLDTSGDAWYGHPRPLACPAGRASRFLALYYYAPAGGDGDASPARPALWRDLPDSELPVAE